MIVILAFLTTISFKAEDILIGLFYGINIQSVVFSAVEGEYILSGNGRQIAAIRKGTMFHIEWTSSGLAVRDTLQSYGIYNNLEFKGISGVNVFQVKPVFPSLPPKESDDVLSISLFNDALRLINQLSLEKYVPGPVEAEGGTSSPLEYYKAQAVIARTFAIKNFHRHSHEGFNLCDGVHCQTFNGKSRMNAQIYAATQSTKDEILVDRNGEPVITAYHANCGGITSRASVEWNRELPYLVPVKDPFCNNSSHRNWSKNLSIMEWNAYLENKGYFAGSGNLYSQTESGRQKYLDRENKKLLLTEMRGNLKLMSSFFYVESGSDSVTIHGHGYGHGLGLCQDGAMEMAGMGYTYVDILMFYFRNLLLAKYSIK
jgi:stage II sporulation protein D